MKKRVALALAGTAAAVAGGLRLVQELVDRGQVTHPDMPPAGPAPDAAPPDPVAGRPAGAEPAPDQPEAEPATSGTASKAPSGATKAELYEIATELKISGRSKMSKGELVEAINKAG